MELAEQPDDPRISQLTGNLLPEPSCRASRAGQGWGALFTSLGDSPTGRPGRHFPHVCLTCFARPYEDRLVKELNADGIFVVIHICGDTSKILEMLAEYEAVRIRS